MPDAIAPWVVVLRSGPRSDDVSCYGPLGEATAKRFAEFLTAEVDPAVAMPLRSPMGELLSWAGIVHAVRPCHRPGAACECSATTGS